MEVALQKPAKLSLPKYYRVVLETSVRSSLHSESVVSTGWEGPEAGDVPERWGSWSLQRREWCASLVFWWERPWWIWVRNHDMWDRSESPDDNGCQSSSVLEAGAVERPEHLKELYNGSAAELNNSSISSVTCPLYSPKGHTTWDEQMW